MVDHATRELVFALSDAANLACRLAARTSATPRDLRDLAETLRSAHIVSLQLRAVAVNLDRHADELDFAEPLRPATLRG